MNRKLVVVVLLASVVASLAMDKITENRKVFENFNVVAKLNGDSLEVSGETDLPDGSVVNISIYRKFFIKVSSEEKINTSGYSAASVNNGKYNAVCEINENELRSYPDSAVNKIDSWLGVEVLYSHDKNEVLRHVVLDGNNGSGHASVDKEKYLIANAMVLFPYVNTPPANDFSDKEILYFKLELRKLYKELMIYKSDLVFQEVGFGRGINGEEYVYKNWHKNISDLYDLYNSKTSSLPDFVRVNEKYLPIAEAISWLRDIGVDYSNHKGQDDRFSKDHLPIIRKTIGM